MASAASALAAGLLTLWALVALADKPAPQPLPTAATTPAPRVPAPAAPSALGDVRTLNRYPGP
jgi:hypothetical protein